MSLHSRPWFPYLFALVLPVTVYSHNQAAFSLGDLLRPLVVFLLLAALLVRIARLIVDDRPLADTIASVPLVGLWLLGYDWQLCLVLAILAMACLPLRRMSLPVGIVPMLNALSLGLLLWPTSLILQVESEASPLVHTGTPASPFSALRARSMVVERPDIYHVVLDAYAGADTLAGELGFDNSVFFEQLRSLGFEVGESVIVPYNETVHVMSSVFVGDYLRPGEYPLDKDEATMLRASMGGLITDAPTHNILRRNGYSLVYTDPGHEFLRFPDDAVVLRIDDRFQLNRFEHYLGSVARLDLILPGVFAVTREDPMIRSVKDAFANDYSGIESPKFVYQHVIAPHTPFIIDSAGEHTSAYAEFATPAEGDSVVLGDPARRQRYVNGYLEKLRYVNARVLDQSRRLIASPNRKIIVIHGDHGSGSRYYINDANRTCLRERFTSFIAVYSDMPQIRDELQWVSGPDATPVNLYRSIFSSLLGVDLPLLPRKSHFVNFTTPHRVEALDSSRILRACNQDAIEGLAATTTSMRRRNPEDASRIATVAPNSRTDGR
jgi:hypothetical protein